VLVFTHDAKFDEPALIGALETGAGFIGALGSRRTQDRRVERLRQAGVDDEAIARIHAPCGLDVGARTPAETAVSILAEVIAVRSGRSGESLRETSGPIHAQASAVEPA
jgi:xanthine dehydrogenase accessory factor